MTVIESHDQVGPAPPQARNETPPPPAPAGLRGHGGAAVTIGVAALLAATAFIAQGGSDLGRTTVALLLLTLLAGLLVASAITRAPARVGGGGLTLLAFAALALLTACSIIWSIVPELSWIEADRTLAYLGVFAAAIAGARMAPGAAPALLRGLALAAFAVITYALASRAFPAALAKGEIYARLGQPFGYWNALGTTAALAVPPTLWLGTRRAGRPAANALAYPLLSLLSVALLLSYSRGAMIAAATGALLWIAIVPLRLRTLALLAVSLLGAAPVILWALSKDAFTRNQVPLQVRESVAAGFGLYLVAMALIVLAAGLAIGFRAARRAPTAQLRLRVGVIAALIACLVPVGLVVALVSSDRGLTGTIRADYESFTSSSTKTPGGPSRLLSASSSRGRYWHQARLVFEANPLHGTGAGTFGVARLRYRDDQLVSRHAHGYIPQTLSDLGLIGLTLTLLLLAAWLIGSARAVGVRTRGAAPAHFGADRVALAALALTAVVFGLHSAVDWVWFVPAPAVMALTAAGFVVGRGPLRPGSRRIPLPPPPRAISDDTAELLIPLRTRLHGRLRRNPRPLLAAAIGVVTLLCAWAIWQPLRSDHASDNALDLSAHGRYPAALAAAHDARDLNPLAVRPLAVRSSIDSARGDKRAALHDLEVAVIRFPADPQAWLALADYQLNSLGRPADAIRTVRAALFLDPQSRDAQNVFFEASAKLNPIPGAPAPLPGGQQPISPVSPAPPLPPGG
ncbi:MAG: hypothetical protein NVSMB25_03260 [Thermoleophilaceae bacterium]